MNYVFCGSYRPLLFAIYLKNSGEDVTILAYNNEIIQFCKSEKIKLIHFEKIRATVTTLDEVFRLKETLDGVITKMNFKKKDKFFITANVSSYDSYYLAQELAKRGQVYYKNTDVTFKIYKANRFNPIFIRGMAVKSLLKIVMDLDLIYRDKREDPALGIDDLFLNRNNIKLYLPNRKSEELIIEALKKNKLNYKTFDNIIIDQGPMPEIIKFETIKKMYKDLLKLPNKFALKKHPGQSKDPTYSFFYEIFDGCEEIPSYIPAELFFSNVKKNVVSIFSIALTIAAQLKHLKAISLLDMVSWHNKSFQKECRELLIETSNDKILFPKNLKELKEMLS